MEIISKNDSPATWNKVVKTGQLLQLNDSKEIFRCEMVFRNNMTGVYTFVLKSDEKTVEIKKKIKEGENIVPK